MPPPARSAQTPVENPSTPPAVAVKSQKIDQIQVQQDATTPGDSASQDPAQPASQPAPAEGAASGAPQDPEPQDSLVEEWEEGEEEVAKDEDPVEVAEVSQQETTCCCSPRTVSRPRSSTIKNKLD